MSVTSALNILKRDLSAQAVLRATTRYLGGIDNQVPQTNKLMGLRQDMKVVPASLRLNRHDSVFGVQCTREYSTYYRRPGSNTPTESVRKELSALLENHGLTALKDVVNQVEGKTTPHKIDLSSKLINKESLDLVLSIFSAFPEHFSKLVELDLSYNNLGALSLEDFIKLCEVLKKLPFKKLNLSHTGLGEAKDARLAVLGQALKHKESPLLSLDLENNQLSSASEEYLAEFFEGLKELKHLRKLNLADNELGLIDTNTLKILRDSMSGFSELRLLKLNGNCLGRVQEWFFEPFKNFLKLQFLYLEDNQFSEITDALRKSLTLPALFMLSLRDNKFDKLSANSCENLFRLCNESSKDCMVDLRANSLGKPMTEQLLSIKHIFFVFSLEDQEDTRGTALYNQYYDSVKHSINELKIAVEKLGIETTLTEHEAKIEKFGIEVCRGFLCRREILDFFEKPKQGMFGYIPTAQTYAATLEKMGISRHDSA